MCVNEKEQRHRNTCSLSFDRNDSLKFVNTNRPYTPFSTSFDLLASEVCNMTFLADITSNSPAFQRNYLNHTIKVWVKRSFIPGKSFGFKFSCSSSLSSLFYWNRKHTQIISNKLSQWFMRAPMWRYDGTHLCQNVAGEWIFVLLRGLGHCEHVWWQLASRTCPHASIIN